jgi:hypothetical protein
VDRGDDDPRAAAISSAGQRAAVIALAAPAVDEQFAGLFIGAAASARQVEDYW